MTIEKQLIEAMLAYADDIVPVNRQEIIDFFESKNVPYRQEHVDYLARFGGSNPAFIKKSNIDSSFEIIKYSYHLDSLCEEQLPKDFCRFAVPTIDDHYCIEQSTGIIYRVDETDEGEPVAGSMVSGNIDSFLFVMLLNLDEKIMTELSFDENINDEVIVTFQAENAPYKLAIEDDVMTYYLKKDLLYCLAAQEKYLYTCKLHITLLSCPHCGH